MTLTRNKRTVAVLFSVLLPLLLLLMSYHIVLLFTSLTPAQETVFSFLEGKENLPEDFTPSEASHLEDVKQVMKYADHMLYVLLLGVILALTYYRKEKEFILKSLNYGGKVTVAVMLFLGVLSLLFFDFIFALFHKIFFSRGNWLFAPESMIIWTFPLEFFVSISRNIFILTLFLGILFILSGYTYRYVLRHRN